MQLKVRVLFSAPNIIRRLLLSWLISVTIAYCVIPRSMQNLQTLNALQQMWIPAVVIMCGIFFVTLCILGYCLDTDYLERWFFLPIYSLLAFFTLRSSFTVPFFIVSLLVLVFFACYAVFGWNPASSHCFSKSVTPPTFIWILTALALAFTIFVSVWTVCRVLTFSTPTYDFGIFSQMFYNMKTTGLPMTTVERDGLLSHFHVHVSPIYYLLLPFYWLIPEPATLQVLQAIILASAVIPLWKICRSRNLNPWVSTLICVLLLLYPAYSGGTSYDIHENAFLAPLILWLLYGIERKNAVIIIVSSILILFVKEDAAVYVAIIGLYVVLHALLHKEQRKYRDLLTGIFMVIGSVMWFLYVTDFLATKGDGVMTYRYQNFMYDGSGSLLTVIKSVVLCPMKAVYECVDKEKLSFIALTLLPLLGLPLLTRRFERYILLIPYVLINLMSDYQYQHDIFFQYTFGSVVCMFYLTVLNLADLKVDWIKVPAVLAAILVSISFFTSQVIPKATSYYTNYHNSESYYTTIRDTLSQIPDGASVSATTFYTTQLSQRQILYDVKYASLEHILSTEYVALAPKSKTNYTNYAIDGENGYENFTALLENSGYEIWLQDQGIVIYRKYE